MSRRTIYCYWFLFFLTCVAGCQQESASIKNDYHYIVPQYGQVGLKITSDTLGFSFPDSLYHKIRSINIFSDHGVEYISLFDSKELANKEQLVLIYNFLTRKLVTQIPINRFGTSRRPSFTTVYIKNFDSIFVFGDKNIQIYDSTGFLKRTIKGGEAKPQTQFYSNGNPPIFSGNKLYTGVKPLITKITFSRLKKENILYEFNSEDDTAVACYKYPDIYYKKYYGYPFLSSSYCYNGNGRFVFSFAADTSIYETDLKGYNNNYWAKSYFQSADISAVEKGESAKLIDAQRNYSFNDAYGAIYFDRFKKRYLRVSLRKINEADYKDKRNRSQSMILFNEYFGVIGEIPFPGSVNLERLLFTDEGDIYVELMMTKNNYDIRFVRLEYEEHFSPLTRK